MFSVILIKKYTQLAIMRIIFSDHDTMQFGRGLPSFLRNTRPLPSGQTMLRSLHLAILGTFQPDITAS